MPFERRYYAFLAPLCLLKGVQTHFERRYYAFFRIIMPFERRTNFKLQNSFEQTMMGQIPECYATNLIEISPLVPEKKIMEAFLAYMGVAAILVM